MVVCNPTYLDSHIFQAIFDQCNGFLQSANFSDLYYNATYIHRIFTQWNVRDNLEFWLIITPTRSHLMNDQNQFDIKRKLYHSSAETQFRCFMIQVSREQSGWNLTINRLHNSTGQQV